MRIHYTLLFALLLSLGANAQVRTQLPFSGTRNNAIKTNLLGPFSLGYERMITKRISAAVHFQFIPKISYGSPEQSIGKIGLSTPSTGFGGEINFFPMPGHRGLRGMYFGAYGFYRQAEAFAIKNISYSEGLYQTTVDVAGNFAGSLTQGGIHFGLQHIGKRGFIIGGTIGAGYHALKGLPSFILDNPQMPAILRLIDEYSKGVGGRVALNIGWAF